VKGNDTRLTRCRVKGGGTVVGFGPSVSNVLIDHCDLYYYTSRGVYNADPKDQHGLMFARNWFHEGVLVSGQTLFSTFAFGSENVYRNKDIAATMRFNYLGPRLDRGDHIHVKTSGTIYAFNRIHGDVSDATMHNRFGVGTVFIGNYLPTASIWMRDYDMKVFGNYSKFILVSAGTSKYVSREKDAVFWTGISYQAGIDQDVTSIFQATRNARIAGNTTTGDRSIEVGQTDDNFCNMDPQAAGSLSPGGKAPNGITYAADQSGTTGIHIYDHNVSPTFRADTCIRWYQNVNNNWQQKAPAAWKNDLPAWITALVDPTDRSAQPWKLAENLTPGNASNPTTGPFRSGKAGLMQ
jgi:hypothetical protein